VKVFFLEGKGKKKVFFGRREGFWWKGKKKKQTKEKNFLSSLNNIFQS